MNLLYRFLLIALIALCYFGAGQLAFSMSGGVVGGKIVSVAIFLSEGVALAAVLIFGRWMVAGIFIGQLLLALTSGLSMMSSVGVAVVNSVEATIAVTLFNYFGLDRSLSRVRDVIGLLSLIALVLQPFSALLGNLVLLISSTVTLEQFPVTVFAWWFGNVMGQLLLAPFLLLLYANYREVRIWKMLSVIVFFLGLNYFILFVYPISRLSIILSLTLPAVILLAAYTLTVYSQIATLIISLGATYATREGVGAFATGDVLSDFIDLNFYILVHVTLSLIVGSLFAERRTAEMQLMDKNRILREMVNLREQVEAMHRHDMKNPLNAVINGPRLILETEKGLSKSTTKLLVACEKSGYIILDMINRSLDLYRIETGSYKLNPERVDLLAVLEDVINDSPVVRNSASSDQQVTITDARINRSEPIYVCGERLLCYSLFANLIRNAFEAASANNFVSIGLDCVMTSGACTVTIANEGSVPIKIRDRFFDKLVTSGKKDGMGIGTYSARLFTEVQGGKIWADFSDEHRTRVIVSLPTWPCQSVG